MSNIKNFKYFTLIVSLYSVLLCSGDLLGARIIMIFSISVSAGSFITVMNYIVSNLVTEVYGYQYGRQLIWLGIIATIVFSATNTFFNSFSAPAYWHYEKAYNTVFHISARTAVAYISAILTGDFLNIYILSKWKKLVKGKFYPLRLVSTSIIGESVYIVIFYLILMVGTLPAAEIGELMLASLVTKTVFSLIAAYPAKFVAKKLKKIEACDTYDFDTNYNPFQFLIK